MRRLIVITDSEPEVKHLLNHWELKDAKIIGEQLTVEMRKDRTLIVEAIDPQLVADVMFSHDPSSELATGKLGVKSVQIVENEKPASTPTDDLVKALKAILG